MTKANEDTLGNEAKPTSHSPARRTRATPCMRYSTQGTATLLPRALYLAESEESLFYRIKDHLAREKERTGKKLSQRDFVLGLIERALNVDHLQKV